MSQRKITYCIAASVILHSAIFLGIALELLQRETVVSKPTGWLKTYLYQEPASQITQRAIITRAQNNIAPSKITPKNMVKPTIKTIKTSIKLPGSVMISHNAQNIDYAKLLLALHDLIQLAQQYPRHALFLKQTGTVRIGFVLFPDGHIENLNIAMSSGFADLDKAAVIAIAAVVPVRIAKLYLTQPQNFLVSIVFANNHST